MQIVKVCQLYTVKTGLVNLMFKICPVSNKCKFCMTFYTNTGSYSKIY